MTCKHDQNVMIVENSLSFRRFIMTGGKFDNMSGGDDVTGISFFCSDCGLAARYPSLAEAPHEVLMSFVNAEQHFIAQEFDRADKFAALSKLIGRYDPTLIFNIEVRTLGRAIIEGKPTDFSEARAALWTQFLDLIKERANPRSRRPALEQDLDQRVDAFVARYDPSLILDDDIRALAEAYLSPVTTPLSDGSQGQQRRWRLDQFIAAVAERRESIK